MERLIEGRALIAGRAAGLALASTEPLSLWGGYDPRTGEIIDRRHPLSGEIAALLTNGPDTFCALASLVADELYGRPFPLVALAPDDFASLQSGDWVQVEDGNVTVVARAQGPRIADLG